MRRGRPTIGRRVAKGWEINGRVYSRVGEIGSGAAIGDHSPIVFRDGRNKRQPLACFDHQVYYATDDYIAPDWPVYRQNYQATNGVPNLGPSEYEPGIPTAANLYPLHRRSRDGVLYFFGGEEHLESSIWSPWGFGSGAEIRYDDPDQAFFITLSLLNHGLLAVEILPTDPVPSRSEERLRLERADTGGNWLVTREFALAMYGANPWKFVAPCHTLEYGEDDDGGGDDGGGDDGGVGTD